MMPKKLGIEIMKNISNNQLIDFFLSMQVNSNNKTDYSLHFINDMSLRIPIIKLDSHLKGNRISTANENIIIL